MIEHVDLSQPVYERLKRMILSQELKPGDKIVQEKIAEQLGVSRTPLLKALQALENEYLVESVPRRGMFVRKLDIKEMIDVYHCREAIEGMAARILASKRDHQAVKKLRNCFESYTKADKINEKRYAKSDEVFHKLMVQLTGNKPLDKIYFFGNIYSKVVDLGLVRAPEETLEEHFDIIEAITSGDVEQAEYKARKHIQKSRELLVNQYKNQIKEQ